MIDFGKHMVAPCGMNCSFCYVHHKKKKPCLGCRTVNGNQPKSCRNCKIKDCVLSRNYYFCSECEDFPCKLIKRLDKSYVQRYQESLIKNLNVINKKGMDYFLDYEINRLKCPNCGNPINMHDKKCCECSN